LPQAQPRKNGNLTKTLQFMKRGALA